MDLGLDSSKAFIPLSDLIIDEKVLGSGAFSTVHSGMCRGIPVAIKILKQKYLPAKQLESFKSEFDIMAQINHPNVISFYGICLRKDEFLMVTQLMETDLTTLLFNPKYKLSLFERMKIGRNIARGCNWIHSLGILHRDLKSPNILLSSNLLEVRVCDFGLSQVKKTEDLMLHDSDGPRGTINWMAPEVLNSEVFNEKSDLWSFGIILWELITRDLPFAGLSREEIVDFVVRKKERLKCPPVVRSLQHLLDSCLQWDWKCRPSFESVIHQFCDILIDVAIEDEDGRKFWKENFVHHQFEVEESILWGRFWDKLLRVLPQHHHEMFFGQVCLKHLIVQKDQHSGEETVSVEDFGNLLKYFHLSPNKKESILSRIEEICQEECFFGRVNKDEANALLEKTEPGSFLVRFSSDGSSFTISVMTSTIIKHVRLGYDAIKGTFVLGGESFSSLKELIAKNPILSHPCGGSPFASFLQARVGNYSSTL